MATLMAREFFASFARQQSMSIGSVFMPRSQSQSIEVTQRILSELEAFQGIYWEKVQATTHDACGETAVRIVLGHPGDLSRAHRRFRDVVSPHFYHAGFSVTYAVQSEGGEVVVDCLVDNDEIERAGTSQGLGATRHVVHAGPVPATLERSGGRSLFPR